MQPVTIDEMSRHFTFRVDEASASIFAVPATSLCEFMGFPMDDNMCHTEFCMAKVFPKNGDSDGLVATTYLVCNWIEKNIPDGRRVVTRLIDATTDPSSSPGFVVQTLTAWADAQTRESLLLDVFLLEEGSSDISKSSRAYGDSSAFLYRDHCSRRPLTLQMLRSRISGIIGGCMREVRNKLRSKMPAVRKRKMAAAEAPAPVDGEDRGAHPTTPTAEAAAAYAAAAAPSTAADDSAIAADIQLTRITDALLDCACYVKAYIDEHPRHRFSAEVIHRLIEPATTTAYAANWPTVVAQLNYIEDQAQAYIDGP